MKIITLVPVKNESWILEFTLRNFSLFSDEIIILDDSSTDDSVAIAQNFPKVTVVPFTSKEAHVDMSVRRNILLIEGRKREATHFICLDADESLSIKYIDLMKEHLRSLLPGDTIFLPWVTLFEKGKAFYFASLEKENYKNFIFCDDGKTMYPQQAISEARTPPFHEGKKISTPYTEGCVFHFQYVAKERTRMKQVWYMCNELIEGKRSAKRINATYRHTKNIKSKYEEQTTDPFLAENNNLITTEISDAFHKEMIFSLFETHSVSFFEPLDIWHIDSLQQYFVEKVGRNPHHRTFPNWLLYINDIKNKTRNNIVLKRLPE